MPTQKQVIIINTILEKLSYSKFRSHFHLRNKEVNYVKEKGMDIVEQHAREFIVSRLSSCFPINDGKQTPMNGHPVFIAQHATATCCRGCLEHWHHIKRGTELSQEQQNYVILLIKTWIEKEMRNNDEGNHY